MRPIATGIALVALTLLTGCLGARSATAVQAPTRPAQAPTRAAQASEATIQQISVTDVAPHLKAHPKAVFIDVRMAEEYTEGHAPGAALRPLPELQQWAAGLDKQAAYVVICRSGSRSMKACTALSALGFSDLTNVQGGMLAWEANGTLPVVKGMAPGTRR